MPPEQRARLWDMFELALTGEVDPDAVSFHWHWIMFPLFELVGVDWVYSIGFKALGYPPTWVDTAAEADKVESAIIEFLKTKA